MRHRNCEPQMLLDFHLHRIQKQALRKHSTILCQHRTEGYSSSTRNDRRSASNNIAIIDLQMESLTRYLSLSVLIGKITPFWRTHDAADGVDAGAADAEATTRSRKRDNKCSSLTECSRGRTSPRGSMCPLLSVRRYATVFIPLKPARPRGKVKCCKSLFFVCK